MSPSLFSETRIGVFEGLCGGVRLHGLTRRRLGAVCAAPLDDARGAPPLGQCLSDVRAALKPARTRVRLVLGNAINRYFVLKAHRLLRRESDWYAYARERAAALYGAKPEAWRITLSAAAHGVRVAAAIDTARFDTLRSALAAAALDPAGIVPYLSVAFARARRTACIDADHWLIILDPGCATLIAMAHARPARIVQHRIAQGAGPPLEAQLWREETLLGWAPAATPLVWVAAGEVLRTPGSGATETAARLIATISPAEAQGRASLIAGLLG